MRIGIITRWWSEENYGQILQIYALQHFLRSRGHAPFLIRYCNKNKGARKTVADQDKNVLKEVLLFLLTVSERVKNGALGFIKKDRNKRDFLSFIETHITRTRKYYRTYDELTARELDADVYICGSDQVWNENLLRYYDPLFMQNNNGRPWFLGFGRKEAKRISYAVSFGTQKVSKSYSDFISPFLKSFDALGVREFSALRMCADAGRTDAALVLDPTLLLTRDDYLTMFSCALEEAVPDNSPHVFLYFLNSKITCPWNDMDGLCREINAEMRITTVCGEEVVPFRRKRYDPTIPEWVAAVASSEMVFTNSFHGAIFSIIMRRPFIVFLRDKTDEHFEMNERVTTFLEKLGLGPRIYDPKMSNIKKQMFAPIDWESVEERLGHLKEGSISFLAYSGL